MGSEETVFAEAVHLGSAAERSSYLDRACAGDAALRQSVEELLAAHDRSHGVLESPKTAPNVAAGDPTAPAERTGATVGRYKLLEKLGEGGMGVVYMAEQSHPVRRRVALKIIKPGLDTAQVIARFEAERQALALMDHPSIAKVFDAGATDAGRPYFVMELVQGVPITEYCDQHYLAPRHRLDLFVSVCQAVQHAHQKGIIHRDLKPTNVLVTVDDGGRPVPKVIDFGVAKATAGQRLTDRTLFTEFRQLIGTPLYMSPEQAEVSVVMDVDTRSDVYSLGVMLYELLTGTTPFDKQRLAKAAYEEVRRIIREEEPPRPSTRLSTRGETLATVSARRDTDPKQLSHLVRGDLDWIVMKCLEKDRGRRYETANGLARDVQRYLDDQPVEACPPSKLYRFRKFARRNKSVIATATLVVVVLLVASVVSSWQAVLATRAKLEARRETEKQEAVNQFLNDMLGSGSAVDRTVADPHKGPDVTMRDVVANAAREIEAGSLKDRPEIEAAVRRTLAMVLFNTQQQDKGRAYMRTALDLNRQVYGLDHPATADCMIRLGYYLGGTEGEQLMRDGLTVQRRHLGDDNITVVNSMCLFAHTLRGTRKVPESEAISRQALAIREKLPADLLPPVSAPLYQLASSLSAQKRYAEAEPLLRRAVEIQRRVRGEKPGQPVSFTWHLANVLLNQGKTAEGVPMLREVVASDPANAQALFKLADALRAQSKTAEADQVMSGFVAKLRAEADPAARIGSAGWTCAKFAGTLRQQGNLADAEWLYRQSLVAYRRSKGDLWNTAKIFGFLIDVLREEGNVADAQSFLRESLPVYRAAVADQRRREGETPRFAWIVSSYAERLHADGQFAEAEKQYREGLALRRKLLGEEAVDTSWSLGRLEEVLGDQGKTAEVEALWRERLAYWQKQLAAASTPERRAECDMRQFWPLVNTGQLELAETTCREAVQLDSSDKVILGLNAYAWTLATTSTGSRPRDPGLAVALAEKAVELRPTNGAAWNTLGVARYRAGEFRRAVADLEQSRKLRDGGDAFDFFFLAMAHERLGDPNASRRWYQRGVEWMEQKAPRDGELARFRAEAEQALHINTASDRRGSSPATTQWLPTSQPR